jgi:hypothetical protein
MHRIVSVLPNEQGHEWFYTGYREEEVCWVVTPRGDRLGSFTCLRNHSPDGFAWGYSGSGPAQLALALLADAALQAGWEDAIELARAHYQKFKAEVIASIPSRQSRWYMHQRLILEWVQDWIGLDLGALAEEAVRPDDPS